MTSITFWDFLIPPPSLFAKSTLFDLLLRRHVWTPPKTFDDVLANDYKVILVGYYHLNMLYHAPSGSGKKLVYEAYFEENDPYYGKENELFRPWSEESFDWAENFIKEDIKTLFYCAYPLPDGGVNLDDRMIALYMHDTFHTWGGYALQGGNSISQHNNHFGNFLGYFLYTLLGNFLLFLMLSDLQYQAIYTGSV